MLHSALWGPPVERAIIARTGREVSGSLLAIFDDVASLRRFLVDEGFLAREAGVYRRAVGGSPQGER